jgi:hypothetical protein
MTAKKKAAASGSRRQVRLMDLQRVEEKCDNLAGQVEALTNLLNAKQSGPFDGLSLEQALLAAATVIGQISPGASLDYQIYGRCKPALRAIKAFIEQDPSGLLDKPKSRTPVKPGGVVTRVQPVPDQPLTETVPPSSSYTMSNIDIQGTQRPSRKPG